MRAPAIGPSPQDEASVGLRPLFRAVVPRPARHRVFRGDHHREEDHRRPLGVAPGAEPASELPADLDLVGRRERGGGEGLGLIFF